ncbi:MAG: hypothetical protein E7590_07455 [Ruminococcaceae bacterium]|nr:hypothetical protein [Oscillospiraceae bacterium]MBE6701907.1 hypothetical protein [Oscillospiraceae bacterium]
MKKRMLFLLLAVAVLAAGVALGVLIATDAAGGADKPVWQAVIEQKILPLVTTAVSAIASYYIMNWPSISKINAAAAQASLSAAGFDGAAGGIVKVTTAVEGAVEKITALEARIVAMEAADSKRHEQDHALLAAGVKIMALAFSHESELVKNGTASAIVKLAEEEQDGSK